MLGAIAKLRSCRQLHSLFGEHGTDELFLRRHAGALLRHIVPAVIVLRSDILQRVVLQAVADFLRDPGLASQGHERPAKVAVRRVGDHARVQLAPDEALERLVAYTLASVFGESPVGYSEAQRAGVKSPQFQ